MDLKVYYRKIRELEASIPEADVVVVSYETPDGGRPGARTEVPRRVAAKLIVEGRARLATPEETAEFRQAMQQARQKAEEQAAARRIRVAVIPESELAPRKPGSRSKK